MNIYIFIINKQIVGLLFNISHDTEQVYIILIDRNQYILRLFTDSVHINGTCKQQEESHSQHLT